MYVKKRYRSLLALIAFFLMLITFPSNGFGNTQDSEEYKIKAGFLYKFLFFVEWPKEAAVEPEKIMTIGILGKDSFGDIFKPIEGEIINGQKLAIKRFEKGTAEKYLKGCHLLFISSSLQEDMEDILQSLKPYPVLTISEVEGFGELGGMINFIIMKDKVRFEINKKAAERVGIKIRSKLLRVSVRVVESNHEDKHKKQK